MSDTATRPLLKTAVRLELAPCADSVRLALAHVSFSEIKIKLRDE